MKIIYNSIIPFPGFSAINLFGIMFVRNTYKGRISQTTINHESIHTEQMKELGYVFFYILYFLEWIVRLFTNTKTAYKSISFEQEAYANQYNYNYLSTRKRYNWFKYWGKQKK